MRTRSILVAPALLLLAACGSTCPQIAADHAAFVEAPARKAEGEPHLVVALPYRFVNGRLRPRLAALPTASIAPPLSGLPRLTLALRAVELRPARDDRVGFRLALALRDGREHLVDLDLDVEAGVRIERKGDRTQVVLGLRPDDLRGVRPKLGRRARARLADALRDRLPGMMRRLVGRKKLESAAGKIVREAVEAAWPKVRDGLLAHLDEVARFGVDIGTVPVAKVTVRHGREAMALGIHAAIPAPGPARRAAGAPPADRVRVRVAGTALAGLANHALATGRLPSRFDGKGKPKDDGLYRPGLVWRPGDERPLGLHVWRTEGTCMRATLAGVPTLAVARETDPKTKRPRPALRVGVEDGRLEDVDGPALIEAGAWLYALWADAVSFTRDVTGEMRFELPGGDWRVSLVDARLDGDDVVLDLDFQAVK